MRSAVRASRLIQRVHEIVQERAQVLREIRA